MAQKEFSIKVLHVAPECVPLIKKGGLGDVAGALPKALKKIGVDARILMPAWPGVLDTARKLGALSKAPVGQLSAAVNWRAWTARIWEAKLPEQRVYLLEQPELFSDENVYPDKVAVWNATPFIFLSYAAFELPAAVGWKPQFIHAHDWTTAAIAPALRWHRWYSKFHGDYDTVFTIHNMAFQGLFDKEGLEGWGFSKEAFSAGDTSSLEFYGQVNLMKGAVTASEAITTVSPSYSWDIQTQNGGFGLDGVMSANKSKLQGIINGIDYDLWNPEKDKLLPKKFGVSNMSGKKDCRSALLRLSGLKDDGRPLAIFVGRLTEQKGIDVMLDALDRLLPDKLFAIIIGSGNELYNRKLSEFADKHRDSVRSFIGFSEEKAHLAYAGGDLLIMPSLFEPCGLSQLIGFAYGTIPVVRATGGLADTVIDADGSPDGTGFLFAEFSGDELAQALQRALAAKHDEQRWAGIVKNAMLQDFSWQKSARSYAELYKKIMTSD